MVRWEEVEQIIKSLIILQYFLHFPLQLSDFPPIIQSRAVLVLPEEQAKTTSCPSVSILLHPQSDILRLQISSSSPWPNRSLHRILSGLPEELLRPTRTPVVVVNFANFLAIHWFYRQRPSATGHSHIKLFNEVSWCKACLSLSSCPFSSVVSLCAVSYDKMSPSRCNQSQSASIDLVLLVGWWFVWLVVM